MKQEVLRQFNLPWIPILGLMIFFACFVVFFFYTYRKSNKKYYEIASFIPLKDELRRK